MIQSALKPKTVPPQYPFTVDFLDTFSIEVEIISFYGKNFIPFVEMRHSFYRIQYHQFNQKSKDKLKVFD
jgi:hypothetical protein